MKNMSPPKSPAMKPMNTTSAPMPKRGPLVPPETKGKTIAQPTMGHGRKVGGLSNDRHSKGL